MITITLGLRVLRSITYLIISCIIQYIYFYLYMCILRMLKKGCQVHFYNYILFKIIVPTSTITKLFFNDHLKWFYR